MSAPSSFPSFFIVGAPKCGTTALYEYLRQHPDVFMPRKEIYYFGRDLTYQGPSPNETYYRSLFEPAREHQISGEASVWYLLSQRAAKAIKDHAPEARIIIMLRDPVQMVHALHFHQVTNSNENIQDFKEALKAEEDRRLGKRLPPLIGSPYESLQYREVGKYKAQVERYLETFGKDRIRIIFFEDFIQNPAESYRNTLAFLGLSLKKEPKYERVNAPQRARNKTLLKLFKQRPSPLIRAGKLLMPSRGMRDSFLRVLEKANSQKIERPPLDEDIREMLKESFREDVKALGELLGKDLESYWWGG